MTVSQLRKKLKGIDGNLPVYIADHDHAEYETNSIANQAYVVDYKDLSDYSKEQMKKRGDEFSRQAKKYLVIRP